MNDRKERQPSGRYNTDFQTPLNSHLSVNHKPFETTVSPVNFENRPVSGIGVHLVGCLFAQFLYIFIGFDHIGFVIDDFPSFRQA